MKHLTRGSRSPLLEHHMLDASPSTSSTGLFAPKPPSADERSRMLTGLKRLRRQMSRGRVCKSSHGYLARERGCNFGGGRCPLCDGRRCKRSWLC
jgi:hypothetical protein